MSIDASDLEHAEGTEAQEGQAAEATEGDETEEEAAEEASEESEGKTKVIRSPGNPSAKERADHEINHWPYRSWCDHCVKGRATGQQHRSMKGEHAESSVARVLMDYGFLHEEETVKESEHGTEVDANISMTMMIMLETKYSSVWAYALDGKGAASLDWLANQVVEDMDTVGLAQERVITKTDQEASIIQLQHEIARQRKDVGTAIENSRVGDSDSNGKIERTIREVKGMIRTFRSDLEEKIGQELRLDSPIVPWIVRHAAYVITRCRVGDDGKTAMQRIKGRKVNVSWVPFGEVVLFKLPKVPRMPGDFRDRFEEGIWVGCTIRSGEHLVATPRGVFKVSSVIRRAEEKRWSVDKVNGIAGTPREPIPGSGSSKLTAYAKHKDTGEDKAAEYMPRRFTEEPEVRPNYIFKRDVEEHGPTEGCPGCRALLNPNSKYRAKHTQECRDRMEQAMTQSNEGASRVIRAHERNNSAKARAEEKEKERDDSGDAKKNGSEAKASSSGSREGKGQQEVEVDKADDAGMEGQRAEETLEEAPDVRGDIRVPLARREPAVKRNRSTSPQRDAKWQAVEVEQGTKRNLDDEAAPEDNKFQAVEDTKDSKGKPADSIEKHPGPVVKEEEITRAEMEWKDIGSGTFARTFKGATSLRVTTKGGPAENDVYRRTVWDLKTGKLIDDCIVEDTPDEVLFRELPQETNVRVELVLKEAIGMYRREGADVVEVFSQPRIAQEAGMRAYGGTKLVPGWSLDLTRFDPKTGRPWDLADKKVQSRVIKMVMEGKPLFLIGSPPCTALSAIQNLNKGKRDPKVVQKEVQAAEEHMRFCVKLYLMQIRSRRYFVHEHPAGATSWKMKEMVELAMERGVDVVTFDMCCFGMVAESEGELGPVRKRTKLASNSTEVLKRVNRRCPNDTGEGPRHEHVILEGGKAKNAQVYPKQFCRAICEGIAAEKRLRSLGLEAYSIDEISMMTEGYGDDPSGELHEKDPDFEEWAEATDDISGEELNPAMVRLARKEEIKYFKDMKVYKKVPLSECLAATGKQPIGVRWVDINKGDVSNPNYRSRLVAREFKVDDKPEWYAATPPSECLKLLISKLASDRQFKMMYADVSRAYFYARAARAVYVKLPDEDLEEGDEGMCGMLNVSMYGTRDAALNWATEYGETLIAGGFKQGKSNPCLFWNESTDVAIMVHGDDFVAVGCEESLKATRKTLNDKYKIKVETLGGEPGDAKEIRVLNKVLRYTGEGVELEADPRHSELVIRQLGLEGAKPSSTPGVKSARFSSVRGEGNQDDAKSGDDTEGEVEMEAADARTYRGVVARLNYMAPERVDIQYAVKEAARCMARPKVKDWHALIRLGKYIRGKPRLVLKYEWQMTEGTISTYTDSDWAGCVETAKSTSGGVITIGKHTVKSYSRQQKTVALSSAEAELHAMVAASAETLGVVGLCKDLGMSVHGEVYADSSAALGIAQRSGKGKLRHLRVQALWVQEVRCSKRLKYTKVLGTRNPADLLTKHVPRELLDVHTHTLGMEFKDGRAESSPDLNSVEAYTEEWEEEIRGAEEVDKDIATSSKQEVRAIVDRKEGSRKVTRFLKATEVRAVPATGKGRPVPKSGKGGLRKEKYVSPGR